MSIQKSEQTHDRLNPASLTQWSSESEHDSRNYLVDILYKAVVFAVLLFFVSYMQLATAGASVEMEQVGQGILFYKSAHDGQLRTAPALHTHVALRVTGFINRAHISQTFTNDSDDWVEGVYVFPLPENAAVDQMRIRIGERTIEGQIKERTEAKKVYEIAKAQGKRASLLEQERPNMFTTSVANIGPHEEISIEIEFQQVLHYDQGTFRLRFPLAITPRYIPGNAPGNNSSLVTSQVPDAARITPLVSLDKKTNPVLLTIELDAGFPVNKIKSTYHAIDQTVHDEERYTITLAEGEIPADRDFELIWEPVHGNAPRAAMFREQVGNDNYYLVMMLPPQQKATEELALTKEVIYVIDTSGSMGGVSIRQARKALLLGLQRLRPRDTFNVIDFNSTTNMLFRNSQSASAQNIAQAQHYVTSLEARGGTGMMDAMHAALAKHEDNQRLRQVIFMTDGATGNEDALFQYIRHHLGAYRLCAKQSFHAQGRAIWSWYLYLYR